MRLILLFLLVPTNLLAVDLVKNAECNVACKKTGYEMGTYKSRYCLCINKRIYEDITGKEQNLSIHPNDIPVNLTVDENNNW